MVQVLRHRPAVIYCPELKWSADLCNIFQLQEFLALLRYWSFRSYRGDLSAKPRTQIRLQIQSILRAACPKKIY